MKLKLIRDSKTFDYFLILQFVDFFNKRKRERERA